MTTFIKTEIKNGVLVIILNRPEKFNSFNVGLSKELSEALDKAASEKTIRVVYLTGEGKAFCAGQDLSDLQTNSKPNQTTSEVVMEAVRKQYNPIVLKLRALEKPVVCAVNGVAAGAGSSLALACDVVIAATSASFIQAFGKIGLVPDCGGSYFLPRLAGMGKASAMMLLGDKISATDAEKMGMIYKVVADENLTEVAMGAANYLANAPTIGLGLTKKLLNESMNNTLEQQLEAEAIYQGKAASTKDFAEGVTAFLTKRSPVYKGE